MNMIANRTLPASFRSLALSGVAAIALVPHAAFAQESTEAKEPRTVVVDEQAAGGVANISSEEPIDNQIVVTGTLLRGTAPVGSNVIAIGQEKLESTAAASSNELLATIPQVSNYFNGVPTTDLSIAVNQIQIVRPNIRNVSPQTAASSATLILFDGHRIATAGTKQASVDPDVIPTGAIERVEVVTEGGSATYGADAVAGVINFITRKRFDGVRLDGQYGIADDYWQVDANATVGRDWGSGSAYVSYTFTKNDALYGRDRDFIRRLDYTQTGSPPASLRCDLANIRLSNPNATFGVQNLNVPGVNRCDASDDFAIVPEAVRHGALASLFQELGDRTTVQLKAFYSERETTSLNTFTESVNITPANPFYRTIPSRPGATQTVDFSFGPATRNSDPSSVFIQAWGYNAELTQELNDNWRVRGLFNYSQTNSKFNQRGVNNNRLIAAGIGSTPATAINPYDIASTNPALLADLFDNENAGQARDHLLDLRAIVDGRLLALPGGDVRLAVGYEYMHDRLQLREVANVRLGALGNVPYSSYSRRAHAVFGEINIPLFGPDNATTGIESFVISAQGRYDHYSDFGDTFNPKIGATYKPFEWLALRGSWGTSFTAPTPLDQLSSANNMLSFFPFAPFVRPADIPTLNSFGGQFACCTTLAYQGSRPNLQPQTAETWSLGFDFDPTFLTGLHASVSYYNVNFEDILGIPTPGNAIFINFPGNVVTGLPPAGLTRAQIEALRGTALGADAAVNAALADPRPVYSIVDFRTGNFGSVKVEGLDFAVNYSSDIGFGSVDLSVNGNYQLSRITQVSPGAAPFDDLARNTPRLRLQTVVGTNIGNLRAQATWNRTSAYDVDPTTGLVPQTRVDAFDVVNLFFKYDVNGESLLMRDLSFTLNINNVLDQDPPEFRGSGFNQNGYAGGLTLGRMFIFGASKKF